ncbi:MAG: hypothetical protein WBO49_04045 [Candidatus Saccharimonas sp.]
MTLAVDVVKRQGKRPSEAFDRNKLHASIYASCLSVRSHEGHAADTANHVCNVVIAWSDNKPEVTSADIRKQATKALETVHPEAAYLYKHHKQIL